MSLLKESIMQNPRVKLLQQNPMAIKLAILNQFNISVDRFEKPAQGDFKAHAARRVFANNVSAPPNARAPIAALLNTTPNNVYRLQCAYASKDLSIAAIPELYDLLHLHLNANSISKLKFNQWRIHKTPAKQAPYKIKTAILSFITDAKSYGYSNRTIGKMLNRDHKLIEDWYKNNC